jgi:hypothetical protein
MVFKPLGDRGHIAIVFSCLGLSKPKYKTLAVIGLISGICNVIYAVYFFLSFM